jgi:NADH:ubiquinone oxidoreductase subunit 6 (subunit J)
VAAVLFFVASLGVIAGAIAVVSVRNPFYSVIGLVIHLLSLAALFLLLRAEFVAAAQVIVYAGAVMVLYVFVVSYVGLQDEPWRGSGVSGGGAPLKLAATLFCGALLVELCIALLGSGLHAIDTRGAGYVAGFGTPGQIGDLLLTKFLFAFEGASFLLLIAAVGAVLLARRRGGLPDDEVLTVAELLRPPRTTGSMAEGVGFRVGASSGGSGSGSGGAPGGGERPLELEGSATGPDSGEEGGW